jgi:hypothetical protein
MNLRAHAAGAAAELWPLKWLEATSLLDHGLDTRPEPLARRLLEKEADHLAAGIWPASVGIGSRRAAAGPCVTEAMNYPTSSPLPLVCTVRV